MKLLVVMLAIGCGGSQPAAPAPTVAPAPQPTCKQAIDHIASLASHDVTTDDDRSRLRDESDNLVKHCVADGWSEATIKCLSGAATTEASEQCAGTLTQAQTHAMKVGDDPQGVAVIAAKKYAFEAYPQWAAEHPDKECPAALAELREFTSFDSDLDPWGHPYRLMCGPSLPPTAKGVAIQSAGPDGQFDTADDIRSWE
jgi:hypothetical protein